MGKFKGLLLVSDLDGTLLDTNKLISRETLDAIAYFEREGGLFSYVTGRPPFAVAPVLEQYCPTVPVGCLNGGGIYDFSQQCFVDRTPLSRAAFALVDYAVAHFPTVGYEFVTFDTCYLYRPNATIEELRSFERLPPNYVTSYDVPGELCKLLFADEPAGIEALMRGLANCPERADYALMRTADQYYELLPRGCDKGSSLRRLATYLGVDMAHTVAVGDNSNDAPMLRAAALGVAVANATRDAKSAADLVLDAGNDEHALAVLIDRLDSGRITLEN